MYKILIKQQHKFDYEAFKCDFEKETQSLITERL